MVGRIKGNSIIVCLVVGIIKVKKGYFFKYSVL